MQDSPIGLDSHERHGKLLETTQAVPQRNLCQRSTVPSFRYLDEQAFRFNERKGTDASRFVGVLQSIIGERLTYNTVTGKTVAKTTN